MIGVVGGLGPAAGNDLLQKITDNTKATNDQGHLPVTMIQNPSGVVDRTAYLVGKTDINPANEIYKIIAQLYSSGVNVIGIPCNTSHAPRIWNKITKQIQQDGLEVKLIHMIDEVKKHVSKHFPKGIRLGLLATIGTYESSIYKHVLESAGIKVVYPDPETIKKAIHPAIYDENEGGIKRQSNPPSFFAKLHLELGIMDLLNKRVDGIILGCTEIPIAITYIIQEDYPRYRDRTFIDPTHFLARALIKEVDGKRLKTLDELKNRFSTRETSILRYDMIQRPLYPLDIPVIRSS